MKNLFLSMMATLLLGFKRPSQKKSQLVIDDQVDEKTLSLKDFLKQNEDNLENTKTCFGELADTGLEGYMEGDKDIETSAEQAAKDTISNFNIQRNWMIAQYEMRQKQKLEIAKTDPKVLSPELEQAKLEALQNIEWIGVFRYFRVNILYTVNVKSHVPKLRAYIKQLRHEEKRVKKRYLKRIKNKYRKTGEPLPSWLNKKTFWIPITALALMELGIGFKALQYFGSFGINAMVFVFATFFAALTSGAAHLAGTSLAGRSEKAWPQKRQFFFAAILCLIGCIILGGFRLNMDSASLVLIPISLLIAIITAALSFKRAEHQELYDLQNRLKDLPLDIKYFVAEADRLWSNYEQAKVDVDTHYLKLSQASVDERSKAVDDVLNDSKKQLELLDAQEYLSLNKIKTLEREAIEDYKDNLRIHKDKE